MALHDDYARFTPYEVLFPEPSDAEALARTVVEEAAGRGADLDDPHSFLTLGAVTAFVRGIEGGEASDASTHPYGLLLWHALHFEASGRPVYLLGTHVARYLVEGAPGKDSAAPDDSGYLQLPRHLFWMTGSQGTPESVDGLFWHRTPADGLHVLLVTSLRPDGSGLSVVPLPRAPIGDAATWLTLDVRGDGTDFRSEMPGAELDGLYAFETSGEVLKLLSRVFAYAGVAPGALVPGEAGMAGTPEPGGTDEAGERDPQPSALAYTRVTLEG